MSQISKAADRWSPAPDWILELAGAADRHGLRAAGEKVGYSPATISQVLSNSYRGDLTKVETMVRGALMGATVICPVLDEMRRDVCLDWQEKEYAPTSSLRIRMYRACRSGCPHAQAHLKGSTDVEA